MSYSNKLIISTILILTNIFVFSCSSIKTPAEKEKEQKEKNDLALILLVATRCIYSTDTYILYKNTQTKIPVIQDGDKICGGIDNGRFKLTVPKTGTYKFSTDVKSAESAGAGTDLIYYENSTQKGYSHFLSGGYGNSKTGHYEDSFTMTAGQEIIFIFETSTSSSYCVGKDCSNSRGFSTVVTFE